MKYLLLQGGEQFLLYVTVTDGKLTSKSEVWVTIVNSSDDSASVNISKSEIPRGAAAGILSQFPHQFPGRVNGGTIFPSHAVFNQPPLQEFGTRSRPSIQQSSPQFVPQLTTSNTAEKGTRQEPTKGKSIYILTSTCKHTRK